MSDAETLRVQAIRLLEEYDDLRTQLASRRQQLDKACADYGRATNRWGFNPDHLRIEVYYENERKGQ